MLIKPGLALQVMVVQAPRLPLIVFGALAPLSRIIAIMIVMERRKPAAQYLVSSAAVFLAGQNHAIQDLMEPRGSGYVWQEQEPALEEPGVVASAKSNQGRRYAMPTTKMRIVTEQAMKDVRAPLGKKEYAALIT
jgi:hypothetical protein